MPKNADIYSCEICGFKCSKKSNYSAHLLTGKHINRTILNKKMPNQETATTHGFTCDICNKKYKARNSLWYHKKNCYAIQLLTDENKNPTTPSVNVYSTDVILELIKQNTEFKELLLGQSKQAVQSQLDMQQQMLELASESKIVNTTINNNHNKFNLNFFLNEQCKNAMNLTDFLKTIEIHVDDVTNMGRFGFAEGIIRIFMKALNNLDVYERPIHCSDVKREMMYIKDNGIWEKDGDIKHHMKRAIKCISFKNIRKLADWRDANPGWAELHSQLEEDYLHITSECMGGSSTDEDEKLYNKIIRRVANEVFIDKKS